MITSRETIATEVIRQKSIQPPGTPDAEVIQAAATALGITVELVAEAIGRQPA